MASLLTPQGEPHSPFDRPQPRGVEAQGLPLWVWLLLAVGGAITLLMVAVFVFVTLGKKDAAPNVLSPAVAAADDEFRKQIPDLMRQYRANGEHWKNLPPEHQVHRRSIETLLARIAQATSDGNTDDVRASIDIGGLLQRIRATGYLAEWTLAEQWGLMRNLRDGADGDLRWKQIRLVGLQARSEEGNNWDALALCTDGTSEWEPYRFWIVCANGTWKLQDWERLHLGITEAERWGIVCKYVNTKYELNYERWSDLLQSAMRSATEGDRAAATAQVQAAEALEIFPELSGYCQLVTAYYWSHIDELDEAERAVRKVPRPEEHPGAIHYLAFLSGAVDSTEPLNHIAKYEALLGPLPDLSARKAALLTDEHAQREAWLEVIRMQPDYQGALANIVDLSTAGQLAELETIIASQPQPLQSLADTFDAVRYDSYEKLQWGRDVVHRTVPASPLDSYAAGTINELQGDYATAAQDYLRAISAEQDGERKTTYVEAYLQVMIEQNQVLDALSHVPDLAEAYETIDYYYSEGEFEISDAEYKDIEAYYAEQFPESPDVLYDAVQQAYDDGGFARCEALARQAIATLAKPNGGSTNESADDVDGDSYYRDWIHSLLGRALARQDRLAEALAESDDRAGLLEFLCNEAISDERWEDVRAHLPQFSAAAEDQLEVKVVQGRLAAHDNDWPTAVRCFQEVLEADADADSQSDYAHQLRADQIVSTMADAGRVFELYGMTPNKSSMFADLARRLRDDADWTNHDKLVAAHRAQQPDDRELTMAEVAAAWEHRDYQRVKSLASPLLVAEEGVEYNYQLAGMAERYTIACIRTSDFAAVHAFAHADSQQANENELLALAYAAEDNDVMARKFALLLAQEDAASSLYQHAELAAFFLSPAMTSVHQVEPVAIPYGSLPPLFVLSTNQPLEVDAASIQQHARDLHMQAEVTAIDPGKPEVDQAFLVRVGATPIWVATGVEPAATWPATDVENAPAKLLASPDRWLAVGVGGVSAGAREAMAPEAAQLASRLAPDDADCLVREFGEYGGYARTRTTSPQLVRWSETGRLPTDDLSSMIYLETSSDTELRARRALKQSLRQATAAWRKDPAKPLVLQHELQPQTCLAPIYLQVTTSDYEYGQLTFTGKIVGAGPLAPELAPGLTMQWSEWEVTGWKRGDDTSHSSPSIRWPAAVAQ